MPTFGRDTIRRFANNISELKKLAARDFEDILQVSRSWVEITTMHDQHFQCAIPVFDGLLPEPHNTAVLKLLFTCDHWHGLAKLRLHIEGTLDLLDIETQYIGKHLRSFINKTCATYDTHELRREADARKRRKAKKQAGSSGSAQERMPEELPQTEPDGTAEADEPSPKRLNINTYKAHSLGDYARTIRRLGTTDSYSTVIVSVFH